MKRYSVILFCLLLTCSFAQSIRAGDRAFDKGDYDEAAEAYLVVIEREADNAEAHHKFAKAKTFAAGQLEGDDAEALYSEAETYARRAIELDDSDAEAHMELARALGRLAQFRGVLQSLGLASEVKTELERALELDPSHDGAMHALALWHLEVPWIAGGRSGQVKPLFEQAIAVDPDAIIHYVDYADALLRFNEADAAKAQLEIAISLPAETAADIEDQTKANEMLASSF